MRAGLIARANDKGIGIQTWEAWKHLDFAATAVVTVKDKRFVDHLDRYTGRYDIFDFNSGEFDEDLIRSWIRGHNLDVIFSVETLYDWRIADWARAEGCATVVQGNPELWPHARHDLPEPDRWVWPTNWKPTKEVPVEVVLPVPAPDVSRIGMDAMYDDRLHVVHVGGHRALEDRNGTVAMFDAIRLIRSPVRLTITTQDGPGWKIPAVPRNVELNLITSNVEDRWDLYRDQHLLVMPRRYGGLCLPVQEALAAGLGVAMTNTPPNADTWPIAPIRARPGRSVAMLGGHIRTIVPDSRSLAGVIDGLNTNRDRLADLQWEGRSWVSEHSWEQLAPDYIRVLEEASR